MGYVGFDIQVSYLTRNNKIANLYAEVNFFFPFWRGLFTRLGIPTDFIMCNFILFCLFSFELWWK